MADVLSTIIARVLIEKSPSCRRPPWHSAQWAFKIGTTLWAKSNGAAGFSAAAQIASFSGSSQRIAATARPQR
jgi:hypothetical protein